MEKVVARRQPTDWDIQSMSATERVSQLFELFRRVAARNGKPFPFTEAQKKLEEAKNTVQREELAKLLLEEFAQMQRS